VSMQCLLVNLSAFIYLFIYFIFAILQKILMEVEIHMGLGFRV
jgi:hypothetical protein